MKQKNTHIAILLVLLFALGCQTLPGNGAGDSGGSTDPLLSDPDNPINVSVQLESQLSQMAVISADGGQLSVEDSAGNRFTLDIPAGALVTDTEITMTPVSAIDGLPFANGLVAAVQFQPDGLFLYEDAILTIESAQTIPIENQIHFGYLGDGKDLHLAIPGPDFSKIQIRVPHFSGYGFLAGIAADRTTLLLARAAEDEVRIQQEVANYLQQERIKRENGSTNEVNLDKLRDYLEMYYELVVRPRMLAAGSSCANGKLAIQTLISHERTLQLLGFNDGATGARMNEAIDLIDNVYKMCREEAIKDCKKKVDPSILIRFELDYERQNQLFGRAGSTNIKTTIEEAIMICVSAFTVTGQYDVFTFSGLICNLEKTFTIKANGPMWESTFTFTPTNSQSGTFIVTGAMSTGEVTSAAEGTYTIGFANDGTYQLIMESPSGRYTAAQGITGDMPGGSATLTLTPSTTQECHGQ